MTNIALIAKGLSKAQRAILKRLSDQWRSSDELVSLHHQRPANTATSLCHKALAERRFHLLTIPTEYRIAPRGVLVVEYLERNPND